MPPPLARKGIRRAYSPCDTCCGDAPTVYVKVPVGTINVGFVDGIVESIEECEGTLVGANASIVVPPINVVW